MAKPNLLNYEKPQVVVTMLSQPLNLLANLSYIEVEVDDLEDLGEAP